MSPSRASWRERGSCSERLLAEQAALRSSTLAARASPSALPASLLSLRVESRLTVLSNLSDEPKARERNPERKGEMRGKCDYEFCGELHLLRNDFLGSARCD